LIADAIWLDLGIVARCPSLGGLTGIGASAEAEPDAPPDVVAPISVGAVTPAQVDILLHRLVDVSEVLNWEWRLRLNVKSEEDPHSAAPSKKWQSNRRSA
jgi:hypothetical protein